MPESPNLAILNRQEAQNHAKEYYAPQLALLHDLANYGSNLVIRAYNSSPKKTEDVVICGVLLKQIVAMLDAVEVMLSAGVAHPAFLPGRAAFEASLYMDWILLGDSERKANCYIVSNFREERKWASRAIPGTPEEVEFTLLTTTLGVDMHASQPTLLTEARAHLTEVNRVLAQANLASIDAEFDLKRKGKRKIDVEWYALTGISSIRQLAEAVNRLAEYEMFYGKGSRITHTAAYKDHVRFASGQVRFKPVRHVAEFHELLNFLGVVSFGAFCKVLTKYRPAELSAFSQKYFNEWQAPFMQVKKATYS